MSKSRLILNKLVDRFTSINFELLAEGIYHAAHGILSTPKDSRDILVPDRHLYVEGHLHYNNRSLLSKEAQINVSEVTQRVVGVTISPDDSTIQLQFSKRYSAFSQDNYLGYQDKDVEKAAIAIRDWIIKGELPEKDPSNLLFLIRNKKE